jgi:hypothetical protein
MEITLLKNQLHVTGTADIKTENEGHNGGYNDQAAVQMWPSSQNCHTK